MLIYTPPAPPDRIPVVDLGGSFSPDPAARKAVAWEIHKACRETGFFYVANHRVPRALVDAQFAWAKRFFDLPLAEKNAMPNAAPAVMSGVRAGSVVPVARMQATNPSWARTSQPRR